MYNHPAITWIHGILDAGATTSGAAPNAQRMTRHLCTVLMGRITTASAPAEKKEVDEAHGIKWRTGSRGRWGQGGRRSSGLESIIH